jgi:hypothetical protein
MRRRVRLPVQCRGRRLYRAHGNIELDVSSFGLSMHLAKHGRHPLILDQGLLSSRPAITSPRVGTSLLRSSSLSEGVLQNMVARSDDLYLGESLPLPSQMNMVPLLPAARRLPS